MLYWLVNSRLKTIFLRLGQRCQTEIVEKHLLSLSGISLILKENDQWKQWFWPAIRKLGMFLFYTLRAWEESVSFFATEFCQATAGCKRCVDAQDLSSNEQVEHNSSQRATLRETDFPLQQCMWCLVPHLLMSLRTKADCWIKKASKLVSQQCGSDQEWHISRQIENYTLRTTQVRNRRSIYK